jgi:hypothetical protein
MKLIIDHVLLIVYSSASQRLKRYYGGRRMKAIFDEYPETCTNMWPYLQQRIKEENTVRELYSFSCLSNQSLSLSPVMERSPDDENQATICLRLRYYSVY